MPSAPDKSEPSAAQLADLSALADGTLDPARREEVQAWIASSSELSARYERERRVASLLREARATDRAPAGLRSRVEAQGSARAPRRRLAIRGSLAGAVAAAAAVLAVALIPGSAVAPSVSEAAALATRGVAAPAPGADPQAPGAKLGQSVGDVYFPDWAQRFGWRAVGQRTDHLKGRVAVTVYYQWHGRQLAYTIVGAPALKTPSASVRMLNGTELRTLQLGGRLVVTWRRDNHTCVLSGKGVPASELQQLAAWKVPASA